jgi:hypothetical protein
VRRLTVEGIDIWKTIAEILVKLAGKDQPGLTTRFCSIPRITPKRLTPFMENGGLMSTLLNHAEV